MSGIKIPNYIDNELDNTNRQFFWNNNLSFDLGQSTTPLIAWDRIFRTKYEGGLCIREIKDVCCLGG